MLNMYDLFLGFEARRVKITTNRGAIIDCEIAGAEAEHVELRVYNPKDREYNILTFVMYHAIEQVEIK